MGRPKKNDPSKVYCISLPESQVMKAEEIGYTAQNLTRFLFNKLFSGTSLDNPIMKAFREEIAKEAAISQAQQQKIESERTLQQQQEDQYLEVAEEFRDKWGLTWEKFDRIIRGVELSATLPDYAIYSQITDALNKRQLKPDVFRVLSIVAAKASVNPERLVLTV